MTIPDQKSPAIKSPWQYWIDWVLFPTIFVALTAAFCRSWSWVGWAAVGFVFFTFCEYWVHRSLLHRFFYHGYHEDHHLHPEDYTVFPIWYVPSIFLGFSLVLPPHMFAGFVLAYIWFFSWHHLLHHVDLKDHPWIAAYAKWHLIHHHRAGYNFGITTPIWDMVFCTYKTR